MGRPKALMPLEGSTFIETIVARVRDAGADEVIVVLGAHAGEIREKIRFTRGKVVVNQDYSRGQLSSLQCGLDAVDPRAGAALVTLVDHPLVATATYQAVMAAWRNDREKIVVACMRGRGGHPVLFPRGVFDELMDAGVDEDARVVLRRDVRRVMRLDLDDPGIVADIDLPGDYALYAGRPETE